jgi:NAD(P)-dependent dehydrogenase (short-subunit alcohol dehydrogenase family)
MGLAPPPAFGTAMLPEGTFDGRVVMVTGGGTGLGRAIATEFGRLGASVAIASRNPEHRSEGVAAVEAAGGRGLGVELDIREPEEVSRAFDETEETLGQVTSLVNNAAGNFPVLAEQMSPNAWRTVTDIVLNGTFFCSAEFARRCIAAEIGGSIVNIGATYAWTGGPSTAHSAAAKAGVDNLTKSLAVEWAPHDIRVNCLAPGLFPHGDHPEALARVRRGTDRDATVPAGRVGELHELGWAATYMCSPFAAYLTGHTLVLDGGNWLRRSLVMPTFVPVADQLTEFDERA